MREEEASSAIRTVSRKKGESTENEKGKEMLRGKELGGKGELDFAIRRGEFLLAQNTEENDRQRGRTTVR